MGIVRLPDPRATVYAGDRPTQDALYWLGFGLLVVDAIRSLDPIHSLYARPAGVTIRRATVADAAWVVSLIGALDAHLAAAPTFLPTLETTDLAEQSEWLADPTRALFLAETEGELVGYCDATRTASASPTS